MTTAIHTVAPDAKVAVNLALVAVHVAGADDDAAVAEAIRAEGYSVDLLER